MAPRLAKAKKVEAAALKKGKDKSNDDAEDNMPEIEVEEKAVEKKSNKRGKKPTNGTNGTEKTNGNSVVAPIKKGKKKIEEKSASENESAEESTPSEENGDIFETIEKDEETKPVSNGKGRKKPTKKETVVSSAAKGRRNGKQASEEKDTPEDLEEKSSGQEEIAVEKQKTVSKSRGRKPKVEKDPELPERVETEKSSAAQGKKKGKAKVAKEESPDIENQELSEELAEATEPESSVAQGKKKGKAKVAKGESPEIENKELPEELAEATEPVLDKKSRGKKVKKAQTKEIEKDEEESDEVPPPKKVRGAKKQEKGKGDDNEKMEEDVPEVKPNKGKRVPKKVVDAKSTEEADDAEEPTAKRRRKPADEKAPGEDTKQKPLAKNKNSTDYEELDFSNSSKTCTGKEWNFKIASWNVDGIRAWMIKGGLDYLKHEKPDILCLQEVKCSKEKLPEELANVPGYHAYWLCSDKDGYAGVGIYTTKLAMNVQYGLQNEELDSEGRIITAEYEAFYLVCTYVPNAGRKLVTMPKRLQWNEEFRKFVKELDKKKPVIICGDMNVAHDEIDLANPKTNKKNAGFTAEERTGMTDLLGDGFVDTFRHLNPDKTGAYTFWTYMMNSRAKNVGWRLDYFIVSERLLPSMSDSVIRDSVYGSDHCPVSLFLNISSAEKPKE